MSLGEATGKLGRERLSECLDWLEKCSISKAETGEVIVAMYGLPSFLREAGEHELAARAD